MKKPAKLTRAMDANKEARQKLFLTLKRILDGHSFADFDEAFSAAISYGRALAVELEARASGKGK